MFLLKTIKVLECKIDMIKTQAAFFVYFSINDIIELLQTYITLSCNILDMRMANSDGSRLRCPRGEEKGRGFQAIVVVVKRFCDVGEKNCVSKKRRRKKREEDSKPSLSSKKGFMTSVKNILCPGRGEKKREEPSLLSKKGFIGEKNSGLLF